MFANYINNLVAFPLSNTLPNYINNLVAFPLSYTTPKVKWGIFLSSDRDARKPDLVALVYLLDNGEDTHKSFWCLKDS